MSWIDGMHDLGREPRQHSKASRKSYWEADIDAAMEIVIRLSDNDRYDSKKFVQSVIKKLEPWGKP